MKLGNSYIGLGEGDRSPEIVKLKALLKRKFTPARNTLDDSDLFTPALTAEVRRVQAVYRSERREGAPKYIDGVVNLEFKYDVGLLVRPPKARPVIFTIEGHLSSMWQGPCAVVASILEQQGVCKWQPVGYDNVSLPFKTQTGVDEYIRLLNSTILPDGYPFPENQNHGLLCFSQGGIAGSKAYKQRIRPAQQGSLLAKRRDHMKRVVALGNPWREKDVIAPWVPDPPKAGTQGISDERMTDTPSFWMEHSRHGDLYAENPDDEVGLNRTSIYKIAAENSWSGGPAGMLARVLDAFQDPFDGVVDIARAIIGGAMFVGNMGAHGTYDLGPCIEWMRGVAG